MVDPLLQLHLLLPVVAPRPRLLLLLVVDPLLQLHLLLPVVPASRPFSLTNPAPAGGSSSSSLLVAPPHLLLLPLVVGPTARGCSSWVAPPRLLLPW